MTDPRIVALLDAKSKSGITVQVLSQHARGNLICHGAMILVDGRTAVAGSTALSATSLDSRREVSIVITEMSAVQELNKLFETLLQQTAARRVISSPQIENDDSDDAEED